MHWIDILVLATLLISGAFGYSRGFVHEVLSIAGWIGATFATIHGTPVLKHFTLQFISDPFISALITGVLIFIGTLIILSLATRQISRGVKESALGALDRALGFLFGLLRGAMVVCLIWIGYEWTTPAEKQPEWIYQARTMPMIIQGSDLLKAFVPASEMPPTDKGPKSKKTGTSKDLIKNGKSLLDKATKAIPKTPAGSGKKGYGNKERTQMNRLFELNK